MDPYGGPVPLRRVEGCLPDCDDGADVDFSVQGRDRGPDGSVPLGECLASEEVVFARAGPAAGVDPLQSAPTK